jgi:hypothetical protein
MGSIVVLAFRIMSSSGPHTITNTEYLWIDKNPVDGDLKDMGNVLLLRDHDYKFCLWRNKTYRVCQVEIDDLEHPQDQPFVKIWVKDPFEGIAGYEQIEEVKYEQDYSI